MRVTSRGHQQRRYYAAEIEDVNSDNMMEAPESPDGYTEPKEYEMPNWAMLITTIGLCILFLAVTHFLEVQYRISQPLIAQIVLFIFIITGSLYLHESAHYVVLDYIGYEPSFVWPNRVDFGKEILQTKETVVSLLAPQLLSIFYLALLYIGTSPVVDFMLFWAFGLNLVPSRYDICWAIRRLTWPKGTIVILTESQNYVAFKRG